VVRLARPVFFRDSRGLRRSYSQAIIVGAKAMVQLTVGKPAETLPRYHARSEPTSYCYPRAGYPDASRRWHVQDEEREHQNRCTPRKVEC